MSINAPRPYRSGIGILLLNRDRLAFLGRRVQMPPGVSPWQMPRVASTPANLLAARHGGSLGRKREPIGPKSSRRVRSGFITLSVRFLSCPASANSKSREKLALAVSTRICFPALYQ